MDFSSAHSALSALYGVGVKPRIPRLRGGHLDACFTKRLTPWLTGAGSRRLEGTNISHEDAEGMAYVGVRVEPTVRLGREVEVACSTRTKLN